MNINVLSSAYFNAWNAHDCDALRSTFVMDGVYSAHQWVRFQGGHETYAEHS